MLARLGPIHKPTRIRRPRHPTLSPIRPQEYAPTFPLDMMHILYIYNVFMSPTIFRTQNLRIEIRIREKGHLGRPHCHVIGPDAEASIDLVTFEVLESHGFRNKALREIQMYIAQKSDHLMEAWNEFHEEEKY